jgi:DNA-binding NtrC family response regulator
MMVEMAKDYPLRDGSELLVEPVDAALRPGETYAAALRRFGAAVIRHELARRRGDREEAARALGLSVAELEAELGAVRGDR